MKALLAVCVVLTLAVPAVAEVPPGAEAAIQQVWQQFSDAWARGDARARASLWAEDATLINPFGVEARGRANIEKLFEQESAGFAKGTTHTFSNFSFRFLTPTLAEVDATGEVKGIRGADGAPQPTLTLHVFAIMVEKGGKWQMKDARPYVVTAPPGPQLTATK
jgi:uncharacterized protein (TIGR02246 family)